MEILAGEISCYHLRAVIFLKMELQWRPNTVGKLRKNLPFLKQTAGNNFTQESRHYHQAEKVFAMLHDFVLLCWLFISGTFRL